MNVAVMHPLMFMLRRIIYAAVIVYMDQIPIWGVLIFMYSTLIFAGVLDYVVFGDRPDAIGALGALIIVAGAIFLALREGAIKRAS